MWLRDSANQILSYAPVLKASSSDDSLAALFRGVINAQSRYIKISPYCHAYQPFPESKLQLQRNGAFHLNTVFPAYNPAKTFDCKWELDSLASFLQLSATYYNITGDIDPYEKYTWLETVEIILDAVDAMRVGTYSPDGQVIEPGYKMYGQTNRATETTSNNGHGNPVTSHTGMIRSTFRPSDDATIFQFLIPSNMAFATSLNATLPILSALPPSRGLHNLTTRISTMSAEIRNGITNHGIVSHPDLGAIYAFEVDGYGSRNLMDDANTPSLLSAPLSGYVHSRDEVYLNTRLFALSPTNPYWCQGPHFSGIGGPHTGPMKGWPIASIVRVMTSLDSSGDEVRREVRRLLGATEGLGLVHESVHAWRKGEYTRPWFGWANGLFGEMILVIEREWDGILGESFQPVMESLGTLGEGEQRSMQVND